MCTWFYADYKPLSVIIDKAKKLSLTLMWCLPEKWLKWWALA